MKQRNRILCIGISAFVFFIFLLSFCELTPYEVSFSEGKIKKQYLISEDTYKDYKTLAESNHKGLYKTAFGFCTANENLSAGLKRDNSIFNSILRTISLLLGFFIIKQIIFIRRAGRLLAHFLRCAFWPAFYLSRLSILQEEDGKKRIEAYLPGMI